ncbi:MAG: xanthine dehydrogenase family protein molybdopterin-binding subunit [Chitinophagaceae bacterium]|nr:xanthine dehydrogenase family protein molybdopterin-binding subunit [Chitinophagaceae bacterium]
MDKEINYTESYFADDRVDGIEKVTGKAKFAAEHPLAEMAYAVFVCSTIPKGAIKNMVLYEARNAPGVLDIIYYLNCPTIPGHRPYDKDPNKKGFEWRGLKVFNDNIIYSNGQPIALVIADTLERAVYAASLVKAEYVTEDFITDFEKGKKDEALLKKAGDYKRGEADAYKTAAVFVEDEYTIPIETHNPMELHATTAVWEGDNKLTVYDKSQGPKGTQAELARNFGLDEKNVRVVTEYVGGAFGSALRSWPHVPAAVIAARKVKRPVKLVLTREQMFTMVGYRPHAWQKIAIGAGKDGKLVGISHHAISNTSTYEDFSEGIVGVSQFLYDCPNVNTSYKLLPLNINTPTWMRGPGPATGCFALECALDDLSYKLNIDPIELRLINYAEVHPASKLPWTSKFLKECYALGKEKIGWHNRAAIPGSLKENGMLVGYGMAGGVFGAGRGQAAAKGILKSDGSLVLQSAVSDMGPGTSTAMVTIGAELMGLPMNKIKFELGDTDLPPGPTQGGSGSTSAVGAAINAVCDSLKQTLKEMAIQQVPAFSTAKPEDVQYKKGMLFFKSDKTISISYTDLLQQSGKPEIEVIKDSARASAEAQKYAMHSFSVHFVKLQVHPVTGVIRLEHIVSTADAGKIITPKPARSQMVGGAVGGIGMALTEEVVIDHHFGRYVNSNFGDYHVPVNADTPIIDVLFADKPDPIINPMGSKGIGEIALVGVAPAIANAVYNATGKRVRELPITPDKLLS